MKILILCCFLATTALAQDWAFQGDYGPFWWASQYPECAGDRQSPLDILNRNTEYRATLAQPWILEGWNTVPAGAKYTMTNTGKTVHIILEGTDSDAFMVSGGALGGTFKTDAVNFHWGSDDTRGSGHLTDGRSVAGEIHINNYASQYSSWEEATDKPGALAHLAVRIQVGAHNPNFEQIIQCLSLVTYRGDSAECNTFPLVDLLPTNQSAFWRYEGSMTIPPCHQTVSWTVFHETITMSPLQLRAFRDLSENNSTSARIPLVNNYRPVQRINDRIIYTSIEKSQDPEATEEEFESTKKWDYAGEFGPSLWFNGFPQCNLYSQSPINIKQSDTVPDVSFPEFKFHGYKVTPPGAKFTAENNGHTVGIALQARTLYSYGVSEGGLPTNYYANQFHFHWGSNNFQGSEHTIDGSSYPLELHIVHHSSKFPTLGESATQGRGLAVLGFFFTLGEHHEPFERVLDCVRLVKHKGETAECPPFSLYALLPTDVQSFWRYSGSLTTPPCHESVIWTVFETPIEVSQAQLAVFREILMSERGKPDTIMVNNYRPPQPLNNRLVYHHVRKYEAPTTPPPEGSNGANCVYNGNGNGVNGNGNGNGNAGAHVAVSMCALLVANLAAWFVKY